MAMSADQEHVACLVKQTGVGSPSVTSLGESFPENGGPQSDEDDDDFAYVDELRRKIDAEKIHSDDEMPATKHGRYAYLVGDKARFSNTNTETYKIAMKLSYLARITETVSGRPAISELFL